MKVHFLKNDQRNIDAVFFQPAEMDMDAYLQPVSYTGHQQYVIESIATQARKTKTCFAIYAHTRRYISYKAKLRTGEYAISDIILLSKFLIKGLQPLLGFAIIIGSIDKSITYRRAKISISILHELPEIGLYVGRYIKLACPVAIRFFLAVLVIVQNRYVI